MPIEIKNLTARPVSVRLNSGEALHLPAGESLSAVQEAEIEGNEKIKKLQELNLIAVSKW